MEWHPQKIERRKSRQIKVGNVLIGGGAPISVQSMTSTDTNDIKATLEQIRALYEAGADIVRVTVPSLDAAESFASICKNSPVPIVADIHFDYRLALACIEAGADKIRLNPGNIGSREKIFTKIAPFASQTSIEYLLNVIFSCLFKKDYETNIQNKISYDKENDVRHPLHSPVNDIID